ncbi:MAG: sel1 repeat family protein [Kiritimatiellaeota bacterium]|nr:sel1 repeat family protein [Kiritimatiellota bacterium]
MKPLPRKFLIRAIAIGALIPLGFIAFWLMRQAKMRSLGERSYLYESYDKLPFREMATQGDAEAQWKLGHWFYCSVENKDKDPMNKALVEAAKWFRKAAEQGHPNAQHFLGQSYLYGHGVERDNAEAVRWYREAAEQGDAGSQHRLGQTYMYGWNGVEQDTDEGMKWFMKAAAQYHVSAWNAIASIYAEGKYGVPQDKAKALKWFRWVAEYGDSSQRSDAAARIKKLEAETRP